MAPRSSLNNYDHNTGSSWDFELGKREGGPGITSGATQLPI